MKQYSTMKNPTRHVEVPYSLPSKTKTPTIYYTLNHLMTKKSIEQIDGRG